MTERCTVWTLGKKVAVEENVVVVVVFVVVVAVIIVVKRKYAGVKVKEEQTK